MSTVRVEYVGLKDRETDHLYGTGIEWVGKGDIKEVPAANWEKMKKHVDVWREVGAESAPAPIAPKPVMRAAPLDTMTDPEIHVLARDRNYQVHNRLGGENLRKRFVELERADPRVSG